VKAAKWHVTGKLIFHFARLFPWFDKLLHLNNMARTKQTPRRKDDEATGCCEGGSGSAGNGRGGDGCDQNAAVQ
jgi:hypothetical protein